MVTETKQKEKLYWLWFAIDGKQFPECDGNSLTKWHPTAGLIFSAFCQHPDGQDGGCKHIAASLYLLHDCLQPSLGPTDILCYWKKKTTRSTRHALITKVKIEKTNNSMKKHGCKQVKKKSSKKEKGTKRTTQ